MEFKANVQTVVPALEEDDVFSLIWCVWLAMNSSLLLLAQIFVVGSDDVNLRLKIVCAR